MQRNFDRQMWAIQRLSVVSSRFEIGKYEITEFEVEEWNYDVVFVKRVKRIIGDDGKFLNIAYHESYKVGVRGAVKEIYSSLY